MKVGLMRMSNTLKIHVTQEDIDNGIRDDALKCPIARAIKRVVSSFLSVSGYDINFDDGFNFLRIPPPEKVTDFIIAFDAGDPVEPFDFELNLPT
jgi:hypothetical protein